MNVPAPHRRIAGTLLAAALVWPTSAASATDPSGSAGPTEPTDRVALGNRAPEPGPWSGTITTSWRALHDACDGCDLDERVDRGTLTYTLGEAGRAFDPTYRRYETTVTGSGSNVTTIEDDVSGNTQCREAWNVKDLEEGSVNLGVTAPLFMGTYVLVTPTRTGDCFGGGLLDVGGYPYSGIGDGPDTDPFLLRRVPDSAPSPDRWTGTKTFAETLGGELRSYTYTVKVDLTRDSRAPVGLLAAAYSSGTCTPVRCTATRVDARGLVLPALRLPLTVRMQVQARAGWRTVATRQVRSDAEGAWSARFGAPGATPCRLRVAYAGNATYRPARVDRAFAC